MPIRRLEAAAGLTVTYRVVNDETGAEVTGSTAAVAGESGEYLTATSIPAGQSAKWYIGGVYSVTDAPLGATPTDVTNAQGAITTAISEKPVTPATDLTGVNTKLDAIAASVSTDVPLGYTRVTSATYGEYLPGTVIDVFTAADTAEATPIADPVTVAANGSWHYDVPTGNAYTLVARLAGKGTHRQAVTV